MQAQAESPQSDARSEVGLVFFQVKFFGRKPVPVVHCLRILIGQVRKLSFIELEIFKKRWKKAPLVNLVQKILIIILKKSRGLLTKLN